MKQRGWIGTAKSLALIGSDSARIAPVLGMVGPSHFRSRLTTSQDRSKFKLRIANGTPEWACKAKAQPNYTQSTVARQPALAPDGILGLYLY